MTHARLIVALALAAAACNQSSPPAPKPPQAATAPTSTATFGNATVNTGTLPGTSTDPTLGGTLGGTPTGGTIDPTTGLPTTTDPTLGTTTGAATGGLDQVNVTPSCVQTSDFWQLAYPADITTCLSQGKVYDFAHARCSPMGRSPFNCTYAELATALQNDSLDTSTLQAKQAAGYKLVNCGSSNDGFTIVFQTIPAAAAANCQYAPGQIQTSCSKRLQPGDTPPATGSDCLQ